MKRLLCAYIEFFIARAAARPRSSAALLASLGLFIALSLQLGTASNRVSALAMENQPGVGAWEFSGDTVTDYLASPCAPGLPPGVIILGVNSQTCQPGLIGGAASSSFGVPPGVEPQIALVQVFCPGSAGCAQAAHSNGQPGELSLTIDGLEMWRAHCDASGVCDSLALGQTPTVALVVNGPSQHIVQLAVTPQTIWEIDHLVVSWKDMPSLVQGVVYSPYRDCQNPNTGPSPTTGDIYQDMTALRNMGNTIRTYSSSGVDGLIPAIAHQSGLRVSAGAWLGPDPVKNQQEINAVIALSHTVDLESVIVGSETLFRGDLSEDQLLGDIQQVKAAVSVPVTTAEVATVLLNHPRVMQAVDYELVDINPYQDGVPIQSAAFYVVNQYRQVQFVANGRRVVIGETGWPSAGPINGQAVPSPENQRRFLRDFITLAQQQNVEFYYASAFNELWRPESAGPFWGMMAADRLNLYDLQSLFVPLHDHVQLFGSTSAPPATTSPNSAQAGIFPVYTNYAVTSDDPTVSNHFVPSGLMGDRAAIHLDDCVQRGSDWHDRMIQIRYTPDALDPTGWAGIYWQQPANNWAIISGGYDLHGYAQLRFHARSDQDGVPVKFMVGGSAAVAGIGNGSYPSSISSPIFAVEADAAGFVTLSSHWQEFHVDLENANLHNVIDGFGLEVDRTHTPHGVTFYLDDIVFDQTPFAAG